MTNLALKDFNSVFIDEDNSLIGLQVDAIHSGHLGFEESRVRLVRTSLALQIKKGARVAEYAHPNDRRPQGSPVVKAASTVCIDPSIL